MSWLAWAVDDPAPTANAGYVFLNVPRELANPALRRGQVIHSVEGWFTYVNPSAVMRDRGNSWGVTIMQSGQVWRHRRRPTFVNWHAGGPAQNIGTDGIEMEGKDQPWTSPQRESLVRVLLETQEWFGWPAYVQGAPTNRSQEAIRQALLAAAPDAWLGEHTWVSNTSCPSGRDDWGWLMPALEEVDDMLKWIKKASSGTVFATDGIYKWGISTMTKLKEMEKKGLGKGPIQTVSDSLFNSIHHRPPSPLTATQTRAAVKAELASVKSAIVTVRVKVEKTYNQVNIKSGTVLNSVLAALDDLEAKVDAIESGDGATPDEIVNRFKERL